MNEPPRHAAQPVLGRPEPPILFGKFAPAFAKLTLVRRVFRPSLLSPCRHTLSGRRRRGPSTQIMSVKLRTNC